MSSLPGKILIAGAGIGGLTAALACLKRGLDVEVHEQARELKEVGAGLQLSSNATRALFELGLGPALRQTCCEPVGKEIRLWSTGETWKLFDLGTESVARYGYPYLMAYRPDLLAALADAVRAIKPDAIHLGQRCLGFAQDAQGVRLQLERGPVQGAILIGADGVHSQIRQGLFGADRPEFTGLMAWRGVIDMSKLPAHMLRLVGTNWVGPGGHVVHYPLHQGKLMNFVGIRERDDWTLESWNIPGTRDECLADFKGWHEDVQSMIGAIQQPYKWALMSRPAMPQWGIGRVSLLGDACHPTLPFLAQGAAMAIEDGYILARALTSTPDPASALQAYESVRKDRTRRMVEGAAGNAKRFHNPELAHAQGARDYIDREWQEVKVKERYEWLFTYDVNQVQI